MRQENAVAAIVTGDHGNPFSFLGMHRAEGGTVVRAFLPGARAVEVVSRVGKVEVIEEYGCHRCC